MKGKYKLIPLNEAHKSFKDARSPTAEENIIFKHFFMIMKIEDDSAYIVRTSPKGMPILFNNEQQNIGIQGFKIPSELNSDSESNQIEKEVQKFCATLYKHNTRNLYKSLKQIAY